MFKTQLKKLSDKILYDLGNHIYIDCDFHDVDLDQVGKVIHQILTHDPCNENADNEYSWDELINIVKSWKNKVGFSRHKPDEMKDESKFRILPVLFYSGRQGSRRDYDCNENGDAIKISSRETTTASNIEVNFYK